MARVSNSSVAAGTALTQDIQLGGSEWLAVVGVVGNAANAATAAGDVIIWAQPYLDDAVNNNLPTLADITMFPDATNVAVLANSRAQHLVRFRVAGLRKVRIFVKNNNAAAKPVEANYDLG